MTDHNIEAMGQQALREVGRVFTAIDPATPQAMCDTILAAKRIACYGVGREGLMMRALCMRLMHLGLNVHMVGDMTTPPVGVGDLLMVSSGPGGLSTVNALLGVAKGAGAKTLVVTAQPQSDSAQAADVVIHLPAQTMANDQTGDLSLLPMGSLFEAAQLLFFDIISIMLRDQMNQPPEEMRARHTNLE